MYSLPELLPETSWVSVHNIYSIGQDHSTISKHICKRFKNRKNKLKRKKKRLKNSHVTLDYNYWIGKFIFFLTSKNHQPQPSVGMTETTLFQKHFSVSTLLASSYCAMKTQVESPGKHSSCCLLTPNQVENRGNYPDNPSKKRQKPPQLHVYLRCNIFSCSRFR